MVDTLLELKKRIYIGLVGGSDLKKIKDQVGDQGKNDTSKKQKKKRIISLKNSYSRG